MDSVCFKLSSNIQIVPKTRMQEYQGQGNTASLLSPPKKGNLLTLSHALLALRLVPYQDLHCGELEGFEIALLPRSRARASRKASLPFEPLDRAPVSDTYHRCGMLWSYTVQGLRRQNESESAENDLRPWHQLFAFYLPLTLFPLPPSVTLSLSPSLSIPPPLQHGSEKAHQRLGHAARLSLSFAECFP